MWKLSSTVLTVALLGISKPQSAEAQCTLCAGGETPDLTATTRSGVDCSTLADSAGQNDSPPDPYCLGLQYVGFTECGCPQAPVVSEETCSLCSDVSASFNSDKPLLGTTVAFFPNGEVSTCQELDDLAHLVTSGCEFFQDFGAYCECPNQEVLCPLCPDGSSVPDPDLEVLNLFEDSIDENLREPTCGFLEFAAATIGEARQEEECGPFQDRFAYVCGCPDTTPACTLCPTGEQPRRPNKEIEDLGLTCRDAEEAALTIPSASGCATIQAAGVLFCGCDASNDGEGACGSVCPDGSPVPDKSQDDIGWVDSDLGELTCGQLDASISTFDENFCKFGNFLGTTLCGCEGEAPTCPICEDNSPLPEPFIEVLGFATCMDLAFNYANFEGEDCTAFQATLGVYCGCANEVAIQGACRICDGPLPQPSIFVEADDFDASCGEVEFLANSGELTCDSAKELFSEACCFGSSDDTCSSVCADGSSVPDGDELAFPGITCSQLEDDLATVEFEDCDYIEFLGSELCGCDAPEPSCPVCSDGSPLPDPFLEVFGVDTCIERAFFYAQEAADSDNCKAVQATLGTYCGCEAAPTVSDDICLLCGDGTVPFPNRFVELDDGTDGRCGLLELDANINENIVCSEAQAIWAPLCCFEPTDPPSEAPTPTCSSVCPDGSPVINPDAVAVVDGDTLITCGELESDPTLLDDCDLVNFLGVQICGCQDSSETTCSLCEDGSLLSDPFSDVIGFATCLEIAYNIHTLEAGSTTCVANQATFGTYCGCENPVAEEGACRLCGEGKELPKPNRFVETENTDGPCSQYEFFANDGMITCDEARDLVATECCTIRTPTLPPRTDPPTSLAPMATPPPADPPATAPTDPPATNPPTDPPTDVPTTSSGDTIIPRNWMLGAIVVLLEWCYPY